MLQMPRLGDWLSVFYWAETIFGLEREKAIEGYTKPHEENLHNVYSAINCYDYQIKDNEMGGTRTEGV